MKVYKVELMVIDFDEVGEGITNIIENTKYPNYCINPYVMNIESKDIGEWQDDNPLNIKNTMKSEYNKLFNES